jgi:hypothetical protein
MPASSGPYAASGGSGPGAVSGHDALARLTTIVLLTRAGKTGSKKPGKTQGYHDLHVILLLGTSLTG